ncbi:uncharacterized protein ACMZJ9_003446 [Mantella aurantiaca]
MAAGKHSDYSYFERVSFVPPSQRAIHPHCFLQNMESLRRLMSRKEDHPWKTVLSKWEQFTESLLDHEDWNPWKEWCRSWEIYKQSHSKAPESGKKREAVWQELYRLAKVTAHKLDEATAIRQHLKTQETELVNLQKESLLLKKKCESLNNENLHLKTKCESLNNENLHLKTKCESLNNENLHLKKKCESLNNENLHLKTKCESLNNENLHLKTKCESLNNENFNLKIKFESLKNENLLWKTKCESLQEQQEYQDYKKLLDDQRYKQELEKQKKKRQAAEKENIILNCTLQNNVEQLENLEYEISALKRQLVKIETEKDNSQNYNFNQYTQKYIIVNYPPKEMAIEAADSWHDMAREAGVGCPSRDKIWRRLQRYEDPFLTVNNATYWKLVIRLSRYEDLGTKKPITYFQERSRSPDWY